MLKSFYNFNSCRFKWNIMLSFQESRKQFYILIEPPFAYASVTLPFSQQQFQIGTLILSIKESRKQFYVLIEPPFAYASVVLQLQQLQIQMEHNIINYG